MTCARPQAAAQEVRALRVGLRVRVDGLDLAELERAARRSGSCGSRRPLADDLDVGGVDRERVERDVDRALERVLDRDERGVDDAVLDRHHRVVERRQRRPRRARGATADVEQRLVAEGSLRARGSRPSRGLRREREAQRLFLFRRELQLRGAAVTCLAYSRAWSRWWIEEITMPERLESSSAIDSDWWPDISL